MKILIPFKKAVFSTSMFLVFFLLFLYIFHKAVFEGINAHYILGFLFAIPFITFGLITYYTVKDDMKVSTENMTSGILVVLFGAGMMIALIFISYSNGLSSTTDTAKYHRVLSISDYPKNEVVQYFPQSIPQDAKDVKFFYCLQYQLQNENLALEFTIDKASVDKDEAMFSKKAIWIGTLQEAQNQNNGINTLNFSMLGDEYNNLPGDYKIYAFYNQRYHFNHSDHGEISLAAISTQKDSVIFFEEKW